MLSNLLTHYQNVPEATRIAGKDWYRNAHSTLECLAVKYGLPLNIVCAICAVLSPRLRWTWNVYETEQVILGKLDWLHATKVNVRKARQILETGSIKPLSGPKVSNFYQNLLDPDCPNCVTVDCHTAHLWNYEFHRCHSVRDRHYQGIANDYRQAAWLLGYLPSEFQAILWTAATNGEI